MHSTVETIQFSLPEHLSCPKPTELRNIERDQVRLLVTSNKAEARHSQFYELPEYLQPGDVLVVNTSATRASAFPIDLLNGRKGMVHLSTQLNHKEWLAEIREIRDNNTIRWKEGHEGLLYELPGGGFLRLKQRFYENRELLNLWVIELELKQNFDQYSARHARPIQYENLLNSYPLEYYQTLFSFHPGSSEMPSAARGFTPALVDRLLKKGIVFAPILLHTGVSSLEENESPYPEYAEVSPISAAMINQAKRAGKRIVAVGTTAVRAVESATNPSGEVLPYSGHTELYIESGYEMKAINALLTGFHEPRASHLHMLQSLAGMEHIGKAYRLALEHDYFWHQFGDLHLILTK